MDNKLKVLKQIKYSVKCTHKKVVIMFYCVIIVLLMQFISFIINCL